MKPETKLVLEIAGVALWRQRSGKHPWSVQFAEGPRFDRMARQAAIWLMVGAVLGKGLPDPRPGIERAMKKIENDRWR